MSPAYDRPDWFQFVAYFSGEGTPEERAAIEQWIGARREHEVAARKLRIMWRARQLPTLAPPDEGDAIETVMASIQVVGRPVRWSIPTDRRVPDREVAAMAGVTGVTRLFRSWPRTRLVPHAFPRIAGLGMALGAAILLLVGTTLLGRSRFGWFSGGATDAVAPASSAPREIATRRGQRASFTLADGSRVTLDADSRLRVPADFGTAHTAGAARDLSLEGRAYFDVRHDAAHPFRVHTAQGVAEDIGTSFVVTAFPETHMSTVAVESGIVALRRTTADTARPVLLTLGRGDVAHLSAAGTVSLTRDANIATYTAWTGGTLVFAQISLGDAMPQLARWYDIDLRVTDSTLLERRFTATFHDEPVSQVLEVLEIALKVRASQNGRVVTIAPKA